MRTLFVSIAKFHKFCFVSVARFFLRISFADDANATATRTRSRRKAAPTLGSTDFVTGTELDTLVDVATNDAGVISSGSRPFVVNAVVSLIVCS